MTLTIDYDIITCCHFVVVSLFKSKCCRKSVVHLISYSLITIDTLAKSINIIFLKQDPSDKEGTLYIRTTENRISKRKSLGVKIKESEWIKYFNTKLQRFKSDKRFGAANQINDLISTKLKELSKHDNELIHLPNEKRSFTKYWERYIESIQNYGTKIKHQVVYTKLEKYLGSINKNGLLFIEITPIFLRELRLSLIKTKNPKSLSNNTANHYIKIIKSIVKMAAEDEYFVFSKDPFVTIKSKNSPSVKNVLNANELVYIIKTLFWEDDLKLTRDMFLFQIFANGMRASDLFLLRWNNFNTGRLSYSMFKTSHKISIPVNPNLAAIMHGCLQSTETYNNLLNIFSQPVMREDGSYEKLSFDEIEKRIRRVAYHELEINSFKKEEFANKVEKKKAIKYKDYYINKGDETNLINLIDAKEKLLKYVDDLYVSNIFSQIRIKKENRLNEFVFPILDNNDFKNIDDKNDFTKITEKQYKTVKHATIVYDRKLKKLQKACQVNTLLTSHVARHSFTNLLLTMNDVNLYDLSQSLGHSSITITQNYISNGFNLEKVDYINNELAKQFRKRV